MKTAVRNNRVRHVGRALLVATALAASSDAAAQSSRFASPFLPAGHWSVDAARKLDVMGLAPAGFDAGVRSLRIGEVAHVLAYATRAAAADAFHAELIRGYQARFAEEFGGWSDAAAAGERSAMLEAQPAARVDGAAAEADARQEARTAWLGAASVGAGYVRREGWVLGGIGYSNIDDWTGPFADEEIGSARADGFVALGSPAFALGATPRARSGETHLREAQAVLELGALGIWGGRRAQGFGTGAGGGIILSDVPLDGGGFFLTAPVRLPWILRHLGAVRGEMFLSRLSNGDMIRDPWFWSARVAIEPGRRLRIGINRGIMFGGEGNSAITLDKLWLTFRGEHAGAQGEFANQVLSVDARYRIPAGIPVAAYVEWGMDDLSGGYWRSPAVVAGLEFAALPGLPQASLGVEYASFAAASHKNTIWYRNWAMRGGWTDAGRPLGHSLGGHGREWMLYGGLDLVHARLRLSGDVRMRERRIENLVAPDRVGDATAASLSLAWRLRPSLDLALDGAVERAEAWNASAWNAAVRVHF